MAPGLTTLDLAANQRAMWAEDHTLVWAAYQLEQWQARLAKERGKPAPQRSEVLRLARNSLEHLVEARPEEDTASPQPDLTNKQLKGTALTSFPGQTMSLLGRPAEEMVDSETLDREALRLVGAVETELGEQALDWYTELERDR
ncbi:hypothetical protein ACFVW8_06400 [Streptomyces sp. NPDC058221]|uniref:hypothetical protein n=1 Tax=Streptomyces sp. NPDC058221 TaxID=3346388 RepID=UPI0036ECC90A